MDKSSRRRADAAPVASLGMYDWPELHWANDALWQGLRQRLIDRGIPAPEELERGLGPHELWHRPNLLFAQTCGYPYSKYLRGICRLVATPVYSAQGCTGPDYSSAVIVRRGAGVTSVAQLAGRCAAVNTPDSQSGMSALRAVLAAHARGGKFLGKIVSSGGHRNSMEMVARGQADVAAIDAVMWELAQRIMPETTCQLDVLCWSPAVPGLPFIAPIDTPNTLVEHLRDALAEAVSDPRLREACDALTLTGIAILDDAEYDRVLAMENEAIARGYPSLA